MEEHTKIKIYEIAAMIYGLGFIILAIVMLPLVGLVKAVEYLTGDKDVSK